MEPMVVVPVTRPLASVERSLLVRPVIPRLVVVALVAKSVVPVKTEDEALPSVARPVNQEAPETERSDVEAFVEKSVVPVKIVEDAPASCVKAVWVEDALSM